MKEPVEVLNLWRLDIRSLGLCKTERGSMSWYLATKEMHSEKNVIAEAKKRFTSTWWDEHIITAIEYVGKLVMIDGTPLYEQD